VFEDLNDKVLWQLIKQLHFRTFVGYHHRQFDEQAVKTTEKYSRNWFNAWLMGRNQPWGSAGQPSYTQSYLNHFSA
jgi:hypothetical protein